MYIRAWVGVICLAAATGLVASAAAPQAVIPKRPVAERAKPDDKVGAMTAKFIDGGWDGITIPANQVCRKFGGTGATPRLALDGYHTGTQVILLAFNDETYEPMNNGGHGIVGFRINGKYASTGAMAGEVNIISQGQFIVADNRGGEVPGYLPPCSGGRGNLYSVTVMAVTWADTNPPSYRVLNQTRVELGRY
jgi:hypothetical protein